MLIYRDADWTDSGITNPLHQMFVQQWHELFDRDTPDTWQVRTSNFPAILRELVSVLDVCIHHPRYKHNIGVLLAEAQAASKLDPILRDQFPHATSLLPTQDAPYIGEHAPQHQSELRRRIQAVLGHIQQYPQRLVSKLRALLELDDPKPKEDLYYLVTALATEWSAHGYSWSHLAAGTAVLLDPTQGPFLQRFDKFVQRCDGIPQRFTCRLGLTLPHAASVADLALPGLVFTRGRPPNANSKHESSFYGKAAAEDVFVDVTVDALDFTIARRTAEERTSELFAALNLFLPSHQFNFRGRYAMVWALDNALAGEPQLIPLRQFREHGLRNSENAAKQASLYAQMRQRLASEDLDQINSAMQYHRLALSADSDEARLVNLWVAIETLCRRSGDGDNLISSVSRQIAPSVAVGNLRKILTGLAVGIHRFRHARGIDLPRIQEVFPEATDESVPSESLLAVLLEPAEGARIKALCELLGGHPLLCYRVYRHWLRFRNRSKTRELVTNHLTNVDWQLRRIYRARNDVMHRGRGSAILPRLIRIVNKFRARPLAPSPAR